MNKSLEKLQKKAINAAFSSKWKEAIEYNKKILIEDEDNVDAHLRLGFIHLQKGELFKSKTFYKKALTLQPANPIAKNNIEKITILLKKKTSKKALEEGALLDPNLFINIQGKTRVIPLANLGQSAVLAKLKVGQSVGLKIKKRRVEVRTNQKEYIGALPDDISKRLIFFISSKSEYSAYIKETSRKHVDIFIKEIVLGKKVNKYISFPKNIQEDMKLLTHEKDTAENEQDQKEESDDETPVDLERLAEEAEEKELYGSQVATDEDEDDDD